MIRPNGFIVPCWSVWLGILFITVFYSCENDRREIDKVSNFKTAPPETLRELVTIYSDSGQVRVRVQAPLLIRKQQPEQITELPKGIYIQFFDEHLRDVSHLTADYAIHYEQQKKWIARQNVVVVNKKGEKLNTEKLVWDEGKELLSSDQFVKITTGTEIIFGEGFEANQDFSHYRIYKVKGHLTIKK